MYLYLYNTYNSDYTTWCNLDEKKNYIPDIFSLYRTHFDSKFQYTY